MTQQHKNELPKGGDRPRIEGLYARNAPLFDAADRFNPRYIQLGDIDGSGTTDIFYLAHGEGRAWLNRSEYFQRIFPLIRPKKSR